MSAWLSSATDTVDRITAPIPRIETARLILRAPCLEDWPTLAPIWTEERAAFIGGPFDARDAWNDFMQLIASWTLRGYGALTITDKDDNVLGLAILGHEYGDPFPEIGWLLTAEAEGHGYATEAAIAMRDLGQELRGPDGFVAYIMTGNKASAAIADRIGMIRTDETHPVIAEVPIYRFTTEASQ